MKPIERLQAIMAQLRDKETGCAWDKEQDFASIAPYAIEEAYEVAEAIGQGDMNALREELGDLLLQVVFHAQMAGEQGIFTFDDVVDGICEKLIRRHPNVFGDAKVHSAAEQMVAWEKHKDKEKAESGKGDKDVLAGVPVNMPAMLRALKLQKRAARAGFDWANLAAVFEKLQEEVDELHYVLSHSKAPEEITEELGDMIFCCINLARKLNVDPEEALRFCNRKFISRLGYMQGALDLQHRDITEASLQELNDLWDQAKIAEKTPLSEG